MLLRVLIAATFGAILVGCAGIGTHPAQRDAPIRAEVQGIATYEFGQSREALTVVEDMVREAAKSPDGGADLAADLAALLGTDATYAAKQFACRQLAIIGREDNVPSIAPLLYSEETADMARIALQPIPGNMVDRALIDALDRCPWSVRTGIVNTLGMRGSAMAKPKLRELARGSDPKLAEAAQSALEKIET